MLPTLIFDVTGFILNLVIVLFIIFYLVSMRAKAKKLEEKETKVDTSYHQIVDDALSKERKILDDATQEANEILSNAEYVQKSSQQTIDQAIDKLLQDAQKDATTAAQDFKKSYAASLQQISNSSLSEFQHVTKELQSDLHKQIEAFHTTLLPGLQKQLEEYKVSRMKQAEQTITRVVQEVSQDILNKSISFEDHQKLMTEALDKAKKEGLFE